MRENDVPEVMKYGKAAPGTAVSKESSFWEEDQLKNWIKKSKDPLIVACVNNQTVGICLARIHHPTHNAILENLLVREEFRNKGIGAQLLKRCLQELKAQGVTYVYGLAHLEDTNSIKFLTKRGFKKGYNFTWLEKSLV